MENKIRIIHVAGARPNFMKIAPVIEACRRCGAIESVLVHTGQHYDNEMSDLFFRQLEIPEPDVNIGVGSASHAVQTAEIMKAFEPVVFDYQPDAVLVVGDVNSTVACGLVAAKLGVKLIHIEAGLRSFDRSMPEEINRILTDAMSDLLFCTEKSAVQNLLHEGIAKEKIFLVGNCMIDTLLKNKAKAANSDILEKLNIANINYAVLTLHRPSNVDNMEVFSRILEAVETIGKDMPIIFPVHPRTRKYLAELPGEFGKSPDLIITNPLGYLDFLKLISGARLVLTDSGGIQEETTILKVPCLTLRENTERPVTVEAGSNIVAGTEPEQIIRCYKQIMKIDRQKITTPPLWDGLASERIVKIILQKLSVPSINLTTTPA
jgi:UDP-N-acetylglucosamine 2-epimerase (non-hydrolysing)